MAKSRLHVGLNEHESEVYQRIVASRPAGWFQPEIEPLLMQYCRHVVQARKVAELAGRASEVEDLSVKDYDLILSMQERESRVILSLAAKLRI